MDGFGNSVFEIMIDYSGKTLRFYEDFISVNWSYQGLKRIIFQVFRIFHKAVLNAFEAVIQRHSKCYLFMDYFLSPITGRVVLL